MFNAEQAQAAVAGAPQARMERYLTHRIQEAATSGFNSSLAWLSTDQLALAKDVLEPNGYSVEVVNVDGERSQINIKW